MGDRVTGEEVERAVNLMRYLAGGAAVGTEYVEMAQTMLALYDEWNEAPPAAEEAGWLGTVEMSAKVIDVLGGGPVDEDGPSVVEVVGSDGGPEGFNLFMLAGRHDLERGDRCTLTLRRLAPDTAPSEPPRPELPPKREGWVLTGEWRKAKAGEGYWSYWCSKEGRPAVATVDLTFHVYIALKVPAPPGPGWVVTKYEEPQKGDRWMDGVYGWTTGTPYTTPLPPNGPYPDGRRFIAEQEDRDDDRTRLAKQNYNDLSAVRLVIGSWDSISDRAKVPYLDAADLSLAAGVKAPDPVRLESL